MATRKTRPAYSIIEFANKTAQVAFSLEDREHVVLVNGVPVKWGTYQQCYEAAVAMNTKAAGI